MLISNADIFVYRLVCYGYMISDLYLFLGVLEGTDRGKEREGGGIEGIQGISKGGGGGTGHR